MNFHNRPASVKGATAHLLDSAGYRTKSNGDPLEVLARKFGDHAATVLTKLGGTNEDLAVLKEQFAGLEQKMLESGQRRGTSPVSVGAQFVGDERVKAFLASDPSKGGIDFRFKASLTSATTDAAGSVGDLTSPARGAVEMMPQRRLRVRDLLPVIQVSTGSVEWPSQKGRTNNAAPVAEAAAKPESDIQFELKTTVARVIAHWTKASKQILSDVPQLRGLIDSELLYGLGLKEEAELLNGDGTGQHLTGLVTAATAYSAPFTPADDNGEIDQIGLALLQAALNEYPATGIVMHPSDWMRMRLTKDANGLYLLGSPGGNISQVLFGVPVVATQAMTVDKFLVGNFPAAATIYDRWEARVEVGYVNDDFTKNMVTVLAEERLALAIKQVGALVYGDFGNV